jgi:hypothetical protein
MAHHEGGLALLVSLWMLGTAPNPIGLADRIRHGCETQSDPEPVGWLCARESADLGEGQSEAGRGGGRRSSRSGRKLGLVSLLAARKALRQQKAAAPLFRCKRVLRCGLGVVQLWHS